MSRTVAAALMVGGLLALVVAAFVFRRRAAGTGLARSPLPRESATSVVAPGFVAPGEPLTAVGPDQQQAYEAAFNHLQVRYVDRPRKAIAEAEEAVRAVMADRGYHIDPDH